MFNIIDKVYNYFVSFYFFSILVHFMLKIIGNDKLMKIFNLIKNNKLFDNNKKEKSKNKLIKFLSNIKESLSD